MPQPIIWPLRAISGNNVQGLQAGLPVRRTTQFLQPVLMRQRPRRIGGLLAPDAPVNLPWNVVGMPTLVDLPLASPHVVHQLLPPPATDFAISGITKDSTGAVLASCVVILFRTVDNVVIASSTSDANGVYRFGNLGGGGLGGLYAYYVVAYKAGSPDTAGTTVDTLSGT